MADFDTFSTRKKLAHFDQDLMTMQKQLKNTLVHLDENCCLCTQVHSLEEDLWNTNSTLTDLIKFVKERVQDPESNLCTLPQHPGWIKLFLDVDSNNISALSNKAPLPCMSQLPTFPHSNIYQFLPLNTIGRILCEHISWIYWHCPSLPGVDEEKDINWAGLELFWWLCWLHYFLNPTRV